MTGFTPHSHIIEFDAKLHGKKQNKQKSHFPIQKEEREKKTIKSTAIKAKFIKIPFSRGKYRKQID